MKIRNENLSSLSSLHEVNKKVIDYFTDNHNYKINQLFCINGNLKECISEKQKISVIAVNSILADLVNKKIFLKHSKTVYQFSKQYFYNETSI